MTECLVGSMLKFYQHCPDSGADVLRRLSSAGQSVVGRMEHAGRIVQEGRSDVMLQLASRQAGQPSLSGDTP